MDMVTPPSSPANVSHESLSMQLEQSGKLLHSLSNKLLPIVVFSELALRRCEDEQLRQQIEKIHGAAEQARDILVEMRGLHSVENTSSQT